MKLVSKKVSITILTMLIAFFIPMIANCQPDPGGSPDVPIDGGISLLLIAGGIAGAKKIKDYNKDKSNI